MMQGLERVDEALEQEKLLLARERGVRCSLIPFLFTICVIICLFLFVIGAVRVSGSSMYPELQGGDVVIFSRLDKGLARGDIVVVKNSVTRIIAVGGEVVDLTEDGAVLVDGKALVEPYIQRAKTKEQDTSFPQTVPDGYVFVLGDNRPVSKDSRSRDIGMIAEENVKGKLLFFLRGR